MIIAERVKKQGEENMKTHNDITEIITVLEKNGTVKFKRQPRSKDNKTHIACVKNGLIVIDSTITMTWDSFTHLYLTGYPFVA